MGIFWKDIPAEASVVIEQLISRRTKEFSNIGMAQFLSGSAQMGYNWFDIEPIRNQVYQRIVELYGRDSSTNGSGSDGRELANIIYALGKGGVKKDALPEEILTVFLQNVDQRKLFLNSMDIATIIYG